MSNFKFTIMKLKFLLFSMLLAFVLNAQEPNRSLIISEVRLTGWDNEKYVEITNMGNSDVNLSEFKFGNMRPWASPVFDVWNEPWVPEGDRSFMLPEKVLKPGESFVITGAWDYGPAMYKNSVPGWEGYERMKQAEFKDLADFLIHVIETEEPYPGVKDSVTMHEIDGDIYQYVLHTNIGSGCYYLEHHFAEGDSAVVDQVGGVFDDNGLNFYQGYDVAGVNGATGNSILVRKYSIKNGNLDFANARGVGLEDSEWIPIPILPGYDSWRDLWRTVGNHGAYELNENTLESDILEVDFANKQITVPWGTGRLDGVMRHLVKKPGIAWNYELNTNPEDSVYRACKTGDKLTIYVAGNELQTATFEIVVAEPDENANTVVPVAHVNIASVREGGPIVNNTQNGILGWPRVSQYDHGNDTITGTWHGLAYALRADSLLKYLEKPANASWEFVWVDGTERPDLKNGDKLKVIAQNGLEKEYYLKLQSYMPSHNADLAAITWPDIPDFYRGIYGWIGDTIPNFTSTTYNYTVQVPLDVEGIPRLVAKTIDLNARVEVNRANSLTGLQADRTISFKVIAEDDIVSNTYNVELVKEKDPNDSQPYYAEPFLSELVFWESWNNNFGEICNPGNKPLDLSDYMIAMSFNSNPASVIQSRTEVDDWLYRYDKYVPGYKWVNESDWRINPGILVRDLAVNPIVQPGDVFCFGGIQDWGYASGQIGLENWQVPKQLDVQFLNRGEHVNTWNEPINTDSNPIRKWNNSCWYLFKILNDSIKLGLKPANDPNDFELIEAFGMEDGSIWVIGGKLTDKVQSYRRKPDIFKGNPTLGVSFGTNPEDSEWEFISTSYYADQGYGWPWRALYVGYDIGQHYMFAPRHYLSTISSLVYKVSEGYSMNEEIRGLTTGTTVETFLGNINKSHENQTLTLTSGDKALSTDDVITNNDVLIVLSADSTNTTKYVMEVSENGLSSNAVLTSSRYTVTIDVQPKSASDEHTPGSGTITGFDYGTAIRTIINNVTVPAGATMTVVSGDGSYVPLKMLNFDTTYVSVTVNANTYFEVLAENGTTIITYKLVPQASESSAFVTSDLYSVKQNDLLIDFVPQGTNVQSFLSNVFPSVGASMKVVDKMGFERVVGGVTNDDKLVVTSPNGAVTTVYYISKLATQYVSETTYLAYILSNVYAIDQVNYKIDGASGIADISEFYSGIRAAQGATVVVVDSNGNEKTTGDINGSDMAKVTSADGKMVVMYTFGPLTSTDWMQANQIELYPNPSNGRLNVTGVEKGQRIQVYNSVGSAIINVNVQNNHEIININEHPAGLYLIVVSDQNRLLGKYKAIKY